MASLLALVGCGPYISEREALMFNDAMAWILVIGGSVESYEPNPAGSSPVVVDGNSGSVATTDRDGNGDDNR
jgi:hypothetical protein